MNKGLLLSTFHIWGNMTLKCCRCGRDTAGALQIKALASYLHSSRDLRICQSQVHNVYGGGVNTVLAHRLRVSSPSQKEGLVEQIIAQHGGGEGGSRLCVAFSSPNPNSPISSKAPGHRWRHSLSKYVSLTPLIFSGNAPTDKTRGAPPPPVSY